MNQPPNQSPEPPLALSVPLSRFTSPVGGGSVRWHTSQHHSFMKTLFTALAASLVFGQTAIAEPTSSQSQVAPQLTRRIFKIDDCFPSLELRIAPKDGESNHQLILRFFKQHNIDLGKDKAEIFVNEEHGLLIIRATKEDLDKIERLASGQKENPDKIERPLPDIADKR